MRAAARANPLRGRQILSLLTGSASSASPAPAQPLRQLSNLPEETIYGGPKAQVSNGSAAAQEGKKAPPRVTLRVLGEKYRKQEPITMVTAYDYPSAVHVDQAGIDICLVGDSVSMVVHGHDTTLPVTLEDMLLHCRAVARGALRPLLVGDLPFGYYEQSTAQAVNSAVQFLKTGGMDAVKIEGGIPARVSAARAITEAGIAVMGHVGLTPQAISSLGGFRPQGRTASNAMRVVEHALALEDAGCFAVVLECIPDVVSAAITKALSIPTIGIGAGVHCSGQSRDRRVRFKDNLWTDLLLGHNMEVLVYHDLLGMMQHPHHAKVTPKFCKGYGKIGEAIQVALNEYREEVVARKFPSKEFSPYTMARDEESEFLDALQEQGLPPPSI